MTPPIEGPGAPDRRRADSRAARAENLEGQTAAGARLEEDLRGQEALIRELTENIHQVFWLASANQRQVFYVSPGYEEIFGRSCDSLLRRPMSWLEAIHPEDRPGIEAEVARDRGNRFTREYRIVRPDEAIRWILARGYPVRDTQGRPVRIAGLAEDITERKQLEQALRKSQSELEEAQRVARIGSWSFNARANQVAWSEELHRIFGLKKSEFGGTHEAFVACVHPEDRERVLRVGAKARAAGRPLDIEYRIVTPRGGLKAIQEVARPLRDEEGQLVGLIGTAQDITERKQAEASLQRLAAIIESSNDAIISAGLDGTILTWNRAAERCFGYRAKEVVFQNIGLLCPEDRKAEQAAILGKVWKGQRVQHFETTRLKKDGTPLPVSLTISPVREASGKIVGASKLVRDLSDRQRAQKALGESEMRYEFLVENMVEGVAFCRMLIENGQPRECIYLQVNQAFKRLTGLGDVVGQKGMKAVRGFGEANRELLDRCGRAALSGQPERFEFYSTQLKRWFSVSVCSAKREHFLAVFADVTQRKQAEKQARMLSQRIVAAQEEQRSRVSAALHHDVGSMAVGISAHFDAIQQDLRSGEVGEALKWMKRTRKLFDQSVACLKRLAVELRPPALDVLGLRPALKEFFSQVTTQRGLRIHFRATGRQLRPEANAAMVLFRVAQEAVTNAIKHGRAKRLDVELNTSKEEIALTVRDDGKGFDPRNKRAAAACGLGLRIMREMSVSAGGALTVDSAPDKGTTLSVRLPL